VPRSNAITKVLAYEQDSQNKRIKEFNNILDKFWGAYSFDDYVSVRQLELQNYDPNSFVVIEFKPFDNTIEKPAPYPYEVSSYNAVDYLYENNVLQYLISKDIIQGEEGKLSKYTIYYTGAWIRYTETDEKNIVSSGQESLVIDGKQYVKIDNKYFLFEYGENKLAYVPAYQVGFIRDMWTNGETFVNNWHCAIPFLNKTLKVNSELDIVMSYMAFPQQLRYIPKCTDADCMNGVNRSDGSACKSCKGTGLQVPKATAMDSVTIKLPDVPTDMINIDSILSYKYPPTDIIRLEIEYIEKLTFVSAEEVIQEYESIYK
jgi:hypothetical protein